ncbi:hypothetical protein PRIPAC_90264 [Pristionchus pacificus]|uniref:Uncharacterized protein n=1 Tax=Pristionchus pacificus TaxID=54126 RepID=A0A2A6B7C9_PRIPA|nr:hypothetical protein PRIPAC_90264 [Pristionchus pacificus]|eukprot:PDM61778.1 hypothetical protein PRIPAC_51220 [Pristionchus pacificus]
MENRRHEERPELMAINAGCILLIIGFSAYLLSILKYCLLENRRELSSIFRRCSHIGTYRVYFLECGMLNDIEKVMGNVPVKHLIIYGSMFSSDNSVRKTIIKMVRAHNVHFCINTLILVQRKITKVAERLDIYEYAANSERIFGNTRSFWEKQVRDMNDDSFSVQLMNGESGDYSLRFRIFSTNNLAH